MHQSLLKKVDLTSLKSQVDKLAVEKLETNQADLSKLSDVRDNDVVKKTVYGDLVKKVNAIDTSKLVSKRKHNSDKEGFGRNIEEVENKVPDISALNAKATKIENKIPDKSHLVTNAKLNAEISKIENKMPDATGLVKKKFLTQN